MKEKLTVKEQKEQIFHGCRLWIDQREYYKNKDLAIYFQIKIIKADIALHKGERFWLHRVSNCETCDPFP